MTMPPLKSESRAVSVGRPHATEIVRSIAFGLLAISLIPILLVIGTGYAVGIMGKPAAFSVVKKPEQTKPVRRADADKGGQAWNP
jgi:hypothetical protein